MVLPVPGGPWSRDNSLLSTFLMASSWLKFSLGSPGMSCNRCSCTTRDSIFLEWQMRPNRFSVRHRESVWNSGSRSISSPSLNRSWVIDFHLSRSSYPSEISSGTSELDTSMRISSNEKGLTTTPSARQKSPGSSGSLGFSLSGPLFLFLVGLPSPMLGNWLRICWRDCLWKAGLCCL